MKLHQHCSIVYNVHNAKTQKPSRPLAVHLVVAAEGLPPSARPTHVHLLLLMNLALARKVSRLLRRSATRAEQRAAAIAKKRPPKRRSTLRKSAGIAAEIRAGRKL